MFARSFTCSKSEIRNIEIGKESRMEEYQALEAMYAVRDVMASDAMNFFAIKSAYLIAAYAVGERLTTFQVWSISLL